MPTLRLHTFRITLLQPAAVLLARAGMETIEEACIALLEREGRLPALRARGGWPPFEMRVFFRCQDDHRRKLQQAAKMSPCYHRDDVHHVLLEDWRPERLGMGFVHIITPDTAHARMASIARAQESYEAHPRAHPPKDTP